MAARYWVGGTGTWNASDTTHWASASNGAGGQSVPTSADDVTFDANSGGGTVTVNGNHTVKSFSCGDHTGTLDWDANDNDFTVFGGNVQLSDFGGAIRTIKLGSGTFRFQSISHFQGTGLTWTPGTALVKLTGPKIEASSLNAALLGSFLYPNFEIGPDTGISLHTFSQNPTFTDLKLTGVCKLRGPSITVTATNLTCSVSEKGKGTDWRGEGGTCPIALTNPGVLHWASLQKVNCTSAGIRAYNSLDLGGNTNVQISPHKRGRVIGG